jgi:hypothetical protein
MTNRLNGLFGAVVAGSLMLSSTAAAAAAPAPVPVQQIDQWAALAVLSGGAPAAAVCGSAAATGAQPAGGCVLPVADVPPPPPPAQAVPPPAIVGGGAGISPLFLALSAIIVGAGVWLLTTGTGENKVGTPVPISPT